MHLSRDEKTLFVNNTRGEYLIAFDIQADGTLTNKRNFAQYQGVTKSDTGVTSGADGIAVDNDGRVYAAINSTGGVQVFSPQHEPFGLRGDLAVKGAGRGDIKPGVASGQPVINPLTARGVLGAV